MVAQRYAPKSLLSLIQAHFIHLVSEAYFIPDMVSFASIKHTHVRYNPLEVEAMSNASVVCVTSQVIKLVNINATVFVFYNLVQEAGLVSLSLSIVVIVKN